MFYLKRKFEFDSAHYLNKYKGKCANMHGHHYWMEVCIKGIELDECGILVDFGKLKEIVNNCIVEPFDHKCLNEVYPFTEMNATAENMSKEFFRIIKSNLELTYGDKVILESVEIWETPNSSCLWKE